MMSVAASFLSEKKSNLSNSRTWANTYAQHKQASDAENAIASQIMDLNPVDIEEAMKEKVHRKRKTSR